MGFGFTLALITKGVGSARGRTPPLPRFSAMLHEIRRKGRVVAGQRLVVSLCAPAATPATKETNDDQSFFASALPGA